MNTLHAVADKSSSWGLRITVIEWNPRRRNWGNQHNILITITILIVTIICCSSRRPWKTFCRKSSRLLLSASSAMLCWDGYPFCATSSVIPYSFAYAIWKHRRDLDELQHDNNQAAFVVPGFPSSMTMADFTQHMRGARVSVH